ncbi:geranylgeranyl reductase family protein [Microlunatus soli]|uniref:Geranylgeranyl reductase family n=1 Tax=Microlunatus soli TaxID=630515 RepID=A0A1H1W3K4_9ACTN|nr:geranylgeranyl reductase family protein [Microlunatus soli]SDS90779.1 geranylgeranyl reductase family [Microlunatus soli]
MTGSAAPASGVGSQRRHAATGSGAPSGGAIESDVIVVGAGPGGSAAATYLARSGLNVSLLEKTSFPREKVCGDGLTPRGTKQLIKLGIDISTENGWAHQRGLRFWAGGRHWDLDWPDLTDWPGYGVTRQRADFDQLLANNAVAAGAKLYELANVTEPIISPDTDRITGVLTKDGRRFTAPLVVAADGNSTRISVAMGINRREKLPMGVAVRTYYKSPLHDSPYIESWPELWEGKPGESKLLPGYGWIFPLGDGTCNVGLGILNTSTAFGKVDYKQMLKVWMDNTPPAWGFTDENRVGRVLGAALPMAFNRRPHYTRGLLLVGDAGGMVSPFNGEGIPYAMESAEMAAEAIADAHFRGVGTPAAEKVLQGYPARLNEEWGGYYTLGRVFTKIIGQPALMKVAVKYGLPRKVVMQFTLKMLSHLTDHRDGDIYDRIVNGLSRIAPAT